MFTRENKLRENIIHNWILTWAEVQSGDNSLHIYLYISRADSTSSSAAEHRKVEWLSHKFIHNQ